MHRRGFTLIELVIALVLAAIVALAIGRILVITWRVYAMQTERAALNGNTRTGIALVPAELRELNASDSVGGDIITADSASIEYKAMRSLMFVCQSPSVYGESWGELIVWRNRKYGLRADLDARFDSVVVFAEGNSALRRDNGWIHANVAAVSVAGSLCPGGAGSITVSLTNVTPRGGLSQVANVAPVRGFEVVRIAAYTSRGRLWLGAQRYSKAGVGGYNTIQPIVGPLSANGFRLVYYDWNGNESTAGAAVARVGVTIIGQTGREVFLSGDLRRAVDTLVTSVALRNSRP